LRSKSTVEFRLISDSAIAQSEVWTSLDAETKLQTRRRLSPNEEMTSRFG